MEKRIYKGEWVTRSGIPNRKERLAEHEAFEHSELKKMLDEGWKPCTKRKRQRFKREKPEFKLFGTIHLDIPVEVLIKAGFNK